MSVQKSRKRPKDADFFEYGGGAKMPAASEFCGFKCKEKVYLLCGVFF